MASQLELIQGDLRRLNVRMAMVEDDLDRLRKKKRMALGLTALIRKIDWSDPTTMTYVYIAATIVAAYFARKGMTDD